MFHLLAQEPVPSPGNIIPQFADAVLTEVDHGRQVIRIVTEWLTQQGMAFLINVLIAGVLVIVGAYLIRLLVFSTRKAIQKSTRPNELLEAFVCNVIHKVGWVLLGMLVLQRLGINAAPLIAGASVMGVVIGFACQDSLANLAAGMMIALNHPFKVGDFVSGGGVEGSVAELNIMATTLLTIDNKRVTVPNKVIWGTPITNFSAMERRRLEITVGVTYNTDVAKVKQVAQAVLRANPMILSEPPPLVEILSLNESIVTFVMRPWCKPSDYWPAYFATTTAIKEAFDKNGITVAYPGRVIHLRQDSALPPVRDSDRTATS